MKFNKIINYIIKKNVLKYLINSNMKNKDIAEKLNITTSAVSFHAKKLSNKKLLVHKGNYKYNINKKSIENVIKKLSEDFL